jgi:aspartate/methionine/tyrosine aminotransferase
MTGWRLGFATGPRDLLDGMVKIYQHSATCVTAFAQAGGIEALTSPHSRAASREMVAGYRERRDLTVELLHASEFFDCVPPAGAFYAFPTYRPELPSLVLATRLLEEAHVATVPGSAFGAAGEGALRLCYATSKANIREAFHRMETIMRELV